MAKGPSPLLGYNTNVRHKGRVYHIQTEDSGLKYPHVITHLFADGGRIVASKKTSYAEYVGDENYAAIVKKLMQEQHKAMFIALRDGVYDAEIESTTPGTTPSPAHGGQASSPGAMAAADGASERSQGKRTAGGTPLGGTGGPGTEGGAGLQPSGTAPTAAAAVAAGPAAFDESRSRPSSTPSFEALERAAAAKSAATAAFQAPDIEALERAAAAKAARASVEQVASSGQSPSARRYQTTRPAVATERVGAAERVRGASEGVSVARATGETAAPQRIARQDKTPAESIFGSDLVSERSLDEVILSYLAEDLEDEDR
jgi:hypothetical protein